MHEFEASGAVAGRQKWIVRIRFAVTYPTDVATALRGLAAAGTISGMGQHPG